MDTDARTAQNGAMLSFGLVQNVGQVNLPSTRAEIEFLLLTSRTLRSRRQYRMDSIALNCYWF